MKNYIQNGDMITGTAPVVGVTSGQGLLGRQPVQRRRRNRNRRVGRRDRHHGRHVRSAQGRRNGHRSGLQSAWDDTAKEIAQPGIGLYPVGMAVTATGNGTTTVRVRLDGISTAAAA